MASGKKMNMSDLIEAYLKDFLKTAEELEIRRSDIAERFDCVPSQINYVINTRFTKEHGYMTESKRGGGGYIRIIRVELADEADEIDQMLSLVGDSLTEKDMLNIVQTLLKRDIITERESYLIESVLTDDFLEPISQQKDKVRALLFKKQLEELRYTY